MVYQRESNKKALRPTNVTNVNWLLKFNFGEYIGSFYYREIISIGLSCVGSFFGNINGSLHMSRLLLGDFPQLSSSIPQSQCKGSDYNSSRSADEAAMDFNPFTDRNSSIFKDEKERDQSIQGSLFIVWVIFILWAAWKNRLT